METRIEILGFEDEVVVIQAVIAVKRSYQILVDDESVENVVCDEVFHQMQLSISSNAEIQHWIPMSKPHHLIRGGTIL